MTEIAPTLRLISRMAPDYTQVGVGQHLAPSMATNYYSIEQLRKGWYLYIIIQVRKN